jgi:uncharacterized repeat protein (TIGR01451 family)
VITASHSTVERSAGTLIKPVDLSTSRKTADKTQASAGEVVTYDFVLKNSALMTATRAMLTDTIPAHTIYVPGTLDCGSGLCAYDAGNDVVTWSGEITPGGQVTLTFAVTLTAVQADMTPVLNTAVLDDGYGTLTNLEATFKARGSYLGSSSKHVSTASVKSGDTVTYTIYVRNSGAETTGEMRDKLPSEMIFVPGTLDCGSGYCNEANGVITWMGSIPGRGIIPVQFQAMLSADLSPSTTLIVNTAVVTDSIRLDSYSVTATAGVIRYSIYMPIVPNH